MKYLVRSAFFHQGTCEAHIAEADTRNAVSVTAAMVGAGLGNVDSVQSKRWRVSVHATLLEPTEPGFTGKMNKVQVFQCK